MNISTARDTIQVIVAPVVMVTACGLLLSGMLAHYTAINSRLRDRARERLTLALVEPVEGTRRFATERIDTIDAEMPGLIRRHRLVHRAILCTYTAVVVLIASMFVVGGAALADSSSAGSAAIVVFLAGTACLLVGAALMALEVRVSHQAADTEAARAVAVAVTWSQEAGGAA